MGSVLLRAATPDDYDAIARVVDDRWGRPVLGSLPRLFLDLFHRTSLVIDRDGGLEAFLVGIMSASHPLHAYIHFVGVSPAVRGRRLQRTRPVNVRLRARPIVALLRQACVMLRLSIR